MQPCINWFPAWWLLVVYVCIMSACMFDGQHSLTVFTPVCHAVHHSCYPLQSGQFCRIECAQLWIASCVQSTTSTGQLCTVQSTTVYCHPSYLGLLCTLVLATQLGSSIPPSQTSSGTRLSPSCSSVGIKIAASYRRNLTLWGQCSVKAVWAPTLTLGAVGVWLRLW